jgi:hypothetical protein
MKIVSAKYSPLDTTPRSVMITDDEGINRKR